MALNNRFGSKPSKLTDASGVPGAKFDAGPYIGIIKNNVDANRSGRLQVFIPDLGGQEDNPTHWRTVQYASPFFGMASRPSKNKSQDNDWTKVSHTYGMWFTPPDLENQVLITFVMGNPSRGYWFACINPTVSHNMMPGISGSESIDKEHLSDDLKEALTGKQYPTVEFNETDPKSWSKRGDLTSVPKPIHEEQVRILLEQGLEDDLARGVTSSSSQRESPSTVFGISTPGRDSGANSDLDPNTKAPYYRLGGHQFIMDDGSIEGYDQMIRLRTAGGHQIMMNDSEEIFYIANANGTVWMEFTAEGKVHMYAEDTFSLRAKKEINLHSDTDINMHAGNNINMYAGNTFTQQAKNVEIIGTTEFRAFGGLVGIASGSALNMEAASQGTWQGGSKLMFTAGKIHLNTAGEDAPAVAHPAEITVTEFPDAKKTGLKWKDDGKINSAVTVVPHHEPWLTEHNTVNPTAEVQSSNPTETLPNAIDNTPDLTANMVGPANAVGAGVLSPATADTFNAQPTPDNAVGNLSIQQTKAICAQIGSTTPYNLISPDGSLGKYKCTATTLSAQGFTVTGISNNELADEFNWLGKNGISSRGDFLNSSTMQETVMNANLMNLHSGLVAKGIVTPSMKPSSLSGMLSVANTLGVDGTEIWTKNGSDQGAQLYNQGRYAADVLANTPPPKTFE